MKTVLYVRVSTLDQNTDRQKVNEKDFDLLIEDRCSGAVPFFDRDGGKQIKKIINAGAKISLSLSSVDRLGRNLKDILEVIQFFTEKKVPIHFISQGLTTLDANGKESAMAQMMISILGSVAQMERSQIKERQMEGIHVAKAKGIYKGRTAGSTEKTDKFLSKDKNKKALAYLKKGYTAKDAAEKAGVNKNTITKIIKLALPIAKAD